MGKTFKSMSYGVGRTTSDKTSKHLAGAYKVGYSVPTKKTTMNGTKVRK